MDHRLVGGLGDVEGGGIQDPRERGMNVGSRGRYGGMCMFCFGDRGGVSSGRRKERRKGIYTSIKSERSIL